MTWVRVRLQTRVPSGRASDFFVSTGKYTVNVITYEYSYIVEFSPAQFSASPVLLSAFLLHSPVHVQYMGNTVHVF